MPQTVATQVAGQMLHSAILEKLVPTLRKVELNCLTTFWPVASRYDALGNVSCNLSRHHGVTRQVARKIAQRTNNSFKLRDVKNENDSNVHLVSAW